MPKGIEDELYILIVSIGPMFLITKSSQVHLGPQTGDLRYCSDEGFENDSDFEDDFKMTEEEVFALLAKLTFGNKYIDQFIVTSLTTHSFNVQLEMK